MSRYLHQPFKQQWTRRVLGDSFRVPNTSRTTLPALFSNHLLKHSKGPVI